MVKKITKVKKSEIKEEAVIEPIKPADEVESAKKVAFRAFIESYKVLKPEKYEIKKEALEKKLNEII